MTSIYKTAYPYYSKKKEISKEIVAKDYRLSYEEMLTIKKHMLDNDDSQLCYGVLLMVFKNLNYFPELKNIPKEIIQFVQEQLRIPSAKFDATHPSTVTRYRKRIYEYYGIAPWKKTKEKDDGEVIYPVQYFAEKTAVEISKAHNYPADIINVIVEQFKKNHFELPPFKQLDRLVRHARAAVNEQLFDDLYATLSNQQIEAFRLLLETADDYNRSGYNSLKALPKNPTITHFRELLKHHDWLNSFGDISGNLKNIIPIKLKQFAEQARALDASDLKDFSDAKRYTLISCLIFHAQIQAKDALAITFCRTIFGAHKRAKGKLEKLREYYRTRTQELLGIFSDILGFMASGDSLFKAIGSVYDKVDDCGGVSALKIDCDQAVALNSNNYLLLLEDFFKNKRVAMLYLLEVLDLRSSTQETGLIDAISYILKHKDHSQQYIIDNIDLSFTTKQWRKIICKKEDERHFLHHCYLEICVLSHVADELRSKDLFIMGADSYADYRDELLPIEDCEKILSEYCKKIGIENNGVECVKQLKEKLTAKANAVDESYPDIAELTIDELGKPTLHKRGPKKRPSSAVWYSGSNV